jgi:predicted lipid-binding transport protein (Tim44 family)
MALPLLLVGGEALARMGGGGDFGGGGSWSSGGGGGGGGDGEAIVRLLIWLCLEHPVVGIPLTVGVAGGWIYLKSRDGGLARARKKTVRSRPVQTRTRSLAPLVARDPNFSELLFLDLAQLTYVRAQQLRKRDLNALSSLLSPQARKKLEARPEPPVDQVILGSTRLLSLKLQGPDARLVTEFEANIGQGEVQLYLRERWTWQRRADTLSPGPDRMQVLSCAACGATLETDVDGRCQHCGAALGDGRLQWRVIQVQLDEQRPTRPPELSTGGGQELGTDLPTVVDPRLQPELRALLARHADLSWPGFVDQAKAVFLALQQAWSARSWDRARPFVTDPLFQQQRYWMERYLRAGYTNRLEDIVILRVEPARVTRDAFYESVTVRIFAKLRDWTEDSQGQLVGGSKTQARTFSEYWTFVRAQGHGGGTTVDTEHCPSCGAPLDRVNEGGVCAYCETRLSKAEHSWVLSAITQDEVYGG